MKGYPKIIDEETTLHLMLTGSSIGRFGDGEWRCAAGGACTSQRADPHLAGDLREVLREGGEGFLVGLPNPFHAGAPRTESWIKYTQAPFLPMLNRSAYHSSFITRPDNAPWIDTPSYWAKVHDLWKGKNVILVVGAARDGKGAEKKSLTEEMLSDAAQVRVIIGPRQHAYAQIDSIEGQIVHCVDQEIRSAADQPRVLLCLGTCATVLAWRLWKRGIHALDVGHIGMFMRHAGAYRYQAPDLISDRYLSQIRELHARSSWGADGAKHAAAVRLLIDRFKPETILDYGCGEGKLAAALKPVRVSGYDPGIPDAAKMPKPCELVCCTDVLEHIEPDRVAAVLDHILRLTGKVAYVVVSTRPANAILPDGRNAHLIVQPKEWWIEQIKAAGFQGVDLLTKSGKEFSALLYR